MDDAERSIEHEEPQVPEVAPTGQSAEGSKGITVAVRVRPMNSRETRSAWRPLPEFNAITHLDADGEPAQGQNSVFNVDRVFSEDATTQELYSSVCSKVVSSVVNGINGTVFAYGQTSSGKTHTMQGGGEERGVLQLAAEEIFKLIEASEHTDFSLRACYMEIYNENLRDLLSKDGQDVVKIHEDPRLGVHIVSKEEVVSSYEDIQACVRRGEQFRAVGSTAMNERSSRSHAIFRLTIESRVTNEHGEVSVRSASLNLVDLAGSESVKNTGATGQRAKEGGKINQSLLSLSRVIQQLGEGGSGHVNFRDSKLTRLMQPMLLGNSSMCMVCCVTPAEQFAEETRSTLQFAARAKNVRLNPEINEVLDKNSELKRCKRELMELRERQAKMEALAAGGSGGGDAAAAHAAAQASAAELAAAKLAAQGDKENLAKQLADTQARLANYERIIAAEMLGKADGLMDGDASLLEESLGGFRRHAARPKRHRETWCPGERGSAPLLLPEASVSGGGGSGASSAAASLLSPTSRGPSTHRRRLSANGEDSLLERSGASNDESSMHGGGSSSANDFQVPALEAMLEKRTEELAEKEAEMEAMYESLDASEQAALACKQELATMKDLRAQDAETHSAEVAAANEREAALAAQMAELEADQLQLIQEAKDKDAEHAAALEAAAAAASSEGAGGADAAAARIADLEAQVATLEGEKEALKVDLEGVAEDLEDVTSRLTTSEATLTEATSAAEEAHAQLEAATAKAAALESDADPEYTAELEQRVGRLEAELAEAKDAAAEAAACSDADARATEAEAKFAALTEAAAEAASKAAAEIAAVETRATAAESELATVAEQLATFQASMQAAAEEADAALASKDQELAALTEAIDTAKAELSAQAAAAAEVQAQAMATMEASHATEVEAFSAELSDLTDQLTAKDTELSAAHAAQASGALVQELEEAKASVEALKLQLSNDVRLQEASKQQGAGLERITAEAQRLRDDCTTRDAEIRQLTANKDALESELRVLKETSAGNIAAQSELVEASSAKKMAQQATQIQQLTAECDRLKFKLSEVETRAEKSAAAHEKKVEKYEAELFTAKQEASSSSEVALKCRNLESRSAAAEAKVKAAEATAAEAEANAEKAADAADQARGEVATAHAKLEQMGGQGATAALEAAQADLAAANAEAKQLETELRSVEARLKKTKAESELMQEEALRAGELEARVADLEQQLADAHGREGAASGELEARIAELEESLNEATETAASYEAANGALRHAATTATEGAASKEAAAQAALEAAEARAEAEKSAAAAAQFALAGLEADLKEMAAQGASLEDDKANLEAKVAQAEDQVAEAKKAEAQAREANTAELTRLRDALAKAEEDLVNASSSNSNTAEVEQLRSDMTALVAKHQTQMESSEKELQKKEARIQELDKVKFTQELQGKFKSMISENQEGKKTIKRLTAELAQIKAAAEAEGPRTRSNGNSSSSSDRATAAVQQELMEERERCVKMEAKLRKYVTYTQELEQGKGAADKCVQILRVALNRPAESDTSSDSSTSSGNNELPEMALDLCRRLSDAEDSCNAKVGLDEANARLRADRDACQERCAESEGRLDACRRNETALTAQLETCRQELTAAQAAAAASVQGAGAEAAELAATASEKAREVKFLEAENLQLMLECKDLKKQASAARAELDALKRQTQHAPGSLGLPAMPAANSAKSTAPLATHRAIDKENHLNGDPFTSKAPATTKPAPLPAALQSPTAEEQPAECKQS